MAIPPNGPRTVELRVRELRQIFNSLDPSPFHEQDLAREAEEYIVDSVKELPAKHASQLLVHVEEPGNRDDERALQSAVHAHFERRARHLRQRLRDLIKEGLVSLGIGLTFLVMFFMLSQAAVGMMGESSWSPLVRESLVIGGWVAMWRPMEIFLYRWWPIVGERRLYERVSRIPVRVVPLRQI